MASFRIGMRLGVARFLAVACVLVIASYAGLALVGGGLVAAYLLTVVLKGIRLI